MIGPKEGYKILGGSLHWDHLSVLRSIWLEPRVQRTLTYVMNATYFKEEVVQNQIKLIWTNNRQLSFYGKLRKCVKFYKELCIRKDKEHKVEEAMWRSRLEQVVILLNATLGDPSTQATLANATNFLRRVEERKLERPGLCNRIKWKQVGDQGSRDFFCAYKACSSASHITALEDSGGQVVTS